MLRCQTAKTTTHKPSQCGVPPHYTSFRSPYSSPGHHTCRRHQIHGWLRTQHGSPRLTRSANPGPGPPKLRHGRHSTARTSPGAGDDGPPSEKTLGPGARRRQGGGGADGAGAATQPTTGVQGTASEGGGLDGPVQPPPPRDILNLMPLLYRVKSGRFWRMRRRVRYLYVCRSYSSCSYVGRYSSITGYHYLP